MPEKELMRRLQSIFQGRGFSVIMASSENRYMLMEKEGKKRAVGFSGMDGSITEGEAEMFLSMAENDSADETIFAAVGRLDPGVRSTLRRGSVQIWDRTTLALALGEVQLEVMARKDIPPDMEDGSSAPNAEEAGKGPDSILDRFTGGDTDPVAELRKFKEELKVEEGDFRVEKVSLDDIGGSPKTVKIEAMEEETPGMRTLVIPEDIVPELPEGVTDLISAAARQADALGSLVTENKPEEVRKPPEDILPVAPGRTSRSKACSIAGVPPDSEIETALRPCVLYRVEFTLKPPVEGTPVNRERHYLFDLAGGDMSSIPDSIAGEISSLPEVGKKPQDKSENANFSERDGSLRIRRDIEGEKKTKDVVIHEGEMSTIIEERPYRLVPSSVEITTTRKILVPFWMKVDRGGSPEWMVDAYRGRLVYRSG